MPQQSPTEILLFAMDPMIMALSPSMTTSVMPSSIANYIALLHASNSASLLSTAFEPRTENEAITSAFSLRITALYPVNGGSENMAASKLSL